MTALDGSIFSMEPMERTMANGVRSRPIGRSFAPSPAVIAPTTWPTSVLTGAVGVGAGEVLGAAGGGGSVGAGGSGKGAGGSGTGAGGSGGIGIGSAEAARGANPTATSITSAPIFLTSPQLPTGAVGCGRRRFGNNEAAWQR